MEPCGQTLAADAYVAAQPEHRSMGLSLGSATSYLGKHLAPKVSIHSS